MKRRSRGVVVAVALVELAAGLFLVGVALLELHRVVSLGIVLVLVIGAGLVVAGVQALARGRSPHG
ncbi:hypothetical protein ES689_14070 [Frigoribacterium sp. ACAM 257]|uniref:hypothetical protein n=1 Tax=Frigoribacterium sp. ACAM 257 TaxID=2508998 RepID=UPI0011B9D9BF|nr:hypothetical protein [Frigoribacterium sp. ACAM 257]TWX34966.1 hypothetical protein ES689_14070 [Frigoribacterium sp. ACAM 257]